MTGRYRKNGKERRKKEENEKMIIWEVTEENEVGNTREQSNRGGRWQSLWKTR